MKTYDVVGYAYDGEVYCCDCFFKDGDAQDIEADSILAGDEWSYQPTCYECGVELDVQVVKPKRKRRSSKQEFYVFATLGDEKRWEKREGYRVVVEGVEFFIHKSDQLKDKRAPWIITHGRSGLKMTSRRTKKDATEALKYLVEKYGIDYIERTADKAIQNYIGGVSPLYAEQRETVRA